MATAAKYVAAVSGDEVSAYAFTWAVKNLFRPGDSVVLLTAKFSDAALPSADITAGEYAIPLPQTSSAEDDLAIGAKATELVDKFMQQCQQSQLTSEGKVVDGSPGPHIVQEADAVGATAIVLGTHSRGFLGRTFLGSISDYVRHHSNIPVAVVRPPKEGERDPMLHAGSGRKVVIAVDESPESAHAFSWALRVLVQPEDQLLLLHVQNPMAAPTAAGTDQLGMEDVYVPPDTSGKATVEALAASEKLVEAFMKQAQEGTKASCEGRVVSGGTQERLTEEVATVGADVVVVGSRSHDMLQRTFLGSVSDYLAHNCHCPMLFVKLPKSAGNAESGVKVHAV